MASLTVNTKKVIKQLEDLESMISDLTPVYKNVADLELAQTKLRFRQQVEPDGSPWPVSFTLRRGVGPETGSRALASAAGPIRPWDYVVNSNYKATPPGYRFFDSARGDKILRDTGTLFNSIGRAYGKDYAIVGTNIEYADEVQEGKGPRKERPFIGINRKTFQNIETVIKSYMKGILK